MNNHVTTFCRISIAAAVLAMCQAQEETSEPIELTRLREQFSNRIEQEMKPWRDRYAQELQKLEDRLIKDRKLTEALAVKKEKDNYMQADLSKKPEKPAIPATPEKAKDAMVGTVWLVYDATDKKRENLLDTYHFIDAKNVFVLTSKRAFSWNTRSKEEIAIEFLAGDILIDVYFDDQSAESSYQGRNYKLILAGKTTTR